MIFIIFKKSNEYCIRIRKIFGMNTVFVFGKVGMNTVVVFDRSVSIRIRSITDDRLIWSFEGESEVCSFSMPQIENILFYFWIQWFRTSKVCSRTAPLKIDKSLKAHVNTEQTRKQSKEAVCGNISSREKIPQVEIAKKGSKQPFETFSKFGNVRFLV